MTRLRLGALNAGADKTAEKHTLLVAKWIDTCRHLRRNAGDRASNSTDDVYRPMEISNEDWIVNCPASDVDIRQFLPGVLVLDDIADNSLYVDPSLGTPLEPS